VGILGEEETAFRSYVAKLQDDLLRAKSGAAITENEYERMKGFMPDPSQGPEQFKAQLRIFVDQYQQLLNDKVDSAFKVRRDRSPEALKSVEATYKAPTKAQGAQTPAAQPRQGTEPTQSTTLPTGSGASPERPAAATHRYNPQTGKIEVVK
jgi:hypothetical protein